MDNDLWGTGMETGRDLEAPGADLPILQAVPDPAPLQQQGQPVATSYDVPVGGPSAFDIIKSPRTIATVAGGAVGYWFAPKKTRVLWGVGGAAAAFLFMTFVLPRLGGGSSAPPVY